MARPEPQRSEEAGFPYAMQVDRTRYERAKELFLAACDQPEAQRLAFVERECGQDADLRAAVASLLDFDAGDDLSPPSVPRMGEPAPAEPRFAPGDVFADRYRVVSTLGRGGMGEVYQAVDLTLDVSVALKFPHVTDERYRKQLLDEVRLARSVTHPAVARIYDIGTQEGEYFVSMEYIRGDDLGALLERFGRMPPERVVAIGFALCQGLAAAHEAGVIHRDIKPSNILIDESGDPKLIDFGIAAPVTDRSAARAGTPSYMAPEQLSGEAMTERTDLWSLGAVLYEMCTGRRPFDGTTLEEIREAHRLPLARPAALGVSIEGSLESTLMTALAVDPMLRPASATELAGQLEDRVRDRDRRVARPTPSSSTEPERRQLTVLHCEVDDPDGRIETLDPEDLQAFAESTRRELARVAARYEATLSSDDGLEATMQFGYPIAHEDAAIRAVRAGEEIKERLSSQLRALDAAHGIGTRVRQGVHVGSAVVAASSTSTGSPRLTGNVFRVARSLAQESASGEILVSASAHRLLRGQFESEPYGSVGNFEAHVVRGPRATRDRASEEVSIETPFIGREEELSLILERIRRAESGRGQILFVAGDGGVGKSRLLREIRRRLGTEGFEWRQSQCSPYLRNTAFEPLVDLVRSELALDDVEEPAEAARLLERDAADRDLDSVARRQLAELLSLPPAEAEARPDLSPDARREQVLEALTGWLLRTRDHRLPVFALEDLHWADPSTVDLLERIAEAVAGETAIVIATHRPEWSASWPARSHSTAVNLSPLTADQAAELVHRASVTSLEPSAVARIVERADGIPLFAEELARHASELDATEIPDTLRDTLLARLDRMGDAKPVAQCAAVVGRDFDPNVVASICERPHDEVTASLDALVREDVLIRTRRGSSGMFAFRHALLRDAAYSSLIRARRVALHSRALDVLRGDDATAEQAPELLAFHAEVAGREPLILEFRRRAAERAASRLAHREAITHASRALEALSWQPSTRERDVQELGLQSLLAISLTATEGFGAIVTEQAFERARALCAEVGNPAQQAPILYGIFAFHEARADSKSLAVADQMAALAASADDDVLANVAQANRGHFRLWNGEIESCRDILSGVRQTDDVAAQRALALRFGDDPIVCSPATLACAECALGDVDQGRRTLEAAVARAERLEHPMTLAAVLTFSAVAAQILDDVELCDALVRKNEIVCSEGGFPNWGTAALVQRGWVEIRAGEPAIGIAKIESAIARCSTLGQRLLMQGMRVFVAAGELALGRIEAAVAASGRAIDSADETHERLWLSEAHRIHGDGLLVLDRAAEGEASYRRAIEVAQAQAATLFELRAASRLSRLLSERGDTAEARTLLEKPLSRVADRAVAADIQHARDLLGGL